MDTSRRKWPPDQSPRGQGDCPEANKGDHAFSVFSEAPSSRPPWSGHGPDGHPPFPCPARPGNLARRGRRHPGRAVTARDYDYDNVLQSLQPFPASCGASLDVRRRWSPRMLLAPPPARPTLSTGEGSRRGPRSRALLRRGDAPHREALAQKPSKRAMRAFSCLRAMSTSDPGSVSTATRGAEPLVHRKGDPLPAGRCPPCERPLTTPAARGGGPSPPA